ncbi:hypothetical protein KUV62_09455 [Salipiger bermudensis]|uniref:hypothetical protein n=1 Tax=Salipiger bermudensis TaxID=344736 RepID=UPI001C99D244|nr:hypothetical protein [Salipiger bermudensis]MBY6004133.1 hypothetical protein [Salipiger bermudensis]
MTQSQAQIGNLTYNAADECYQALVTFHTDEGRIRVASSYAAPLDADPEEVERALISDALTAPDRPNRLRARLKPRLSERPRPAPEPKTPLHGAVDWLRRIGGRAA